MTKNTTLQKGQRDQKYIISYRKREYANNLDEIDHWLKKKKFTAISDGIDDKLVIYQKKEIECLVE